MSVAGIMMVRDEADIIERSIEHARSQVDWLIVCDNRSTDGTREILEASDAVSELEFDEEIGYYQSEKMTRLAQLALAEGHSWVVPMDADELWSVEGGVMSVADLLRPMGPDVQIVTANLYDYLPPCAGLGGRHPFDAITRRRTVPGALPKVAARLHEDLVIEMGNHSANYGGSRTLKVPGLMIRHFTWRSPEQYLRKIVNGMEAYRHTDLPFAYGQHWRMHEGASDEEIVAHFHRWFCRDYDVPVDETDELTWDPIGAVFD